jgi:hypothetical protein
MNPPTKLVKREELYEAVRSKTLKALAQEWNTSALRIVEACEAMAVPRPGQGHWQWIAHGIVIEREPLPERTDNMPDELASLPLGGRKE